MRARVVIYGYFRGVASSRRVERATYEDVAVRYWAADQHQDHDTIAAFRQEQLAPLAQFFVQVLQLCQRG
jgi:transposase